MPLVTVRRPGPARWIARWFLALLICFVAAQDAGAAVPFAPSSAWNAPLADTAPLASDSAALVADLNRQVTAYKAFINTSQYSVPVYTVPAGQPNVKVTLDTTAPALAADFAAVPLPADARPAAGSDQHLTVWQPSTDTLWEFWLLSKKTDGWHARWGGKMTGVSKNPGYFPNPYGATATSLPLIGGLMRPDELTARKIDHALAISVWDVRANVVKWPAQRTDGTTTTTASIPEGTRFRFPANLNLDAISMPAATRAMAKAVQRYGMIVRDRAYCVCFYAEDTTQFGTSPYSTIFGTPWMDGNNALRGFPWSKLQAVLGERSALVSPAFA